jgi:hypothetical protein
VDGCLSFGIFCLQTAVTAFQQLRNHMIVSCSSHRKVIESSVTLRITFFGGSVQEICPAVPSAVMGRRLVGSKVFRELDHQPVDVLLIVFDQLL